MTDRPKRRGPVDLEAKRPPIWSGGSRTTEAKDRIIAASRRRAKIAALVLRRKATP